MSLRYIMVGIVGGGALVASFLLFRAPEPTKETLTQAEPEVAVEVADAPEESAPETVEKESIPAPAPIKVSEADKDNPLIFSPPNIAYEKACQPIPFNAVSDYSVSEQVQQILEDRLPEREEMLRLVAQLEAQQSQGGFAGAVASIHLARLYWAGNGVMQARDKAMELLEGARADAPKRAWYEEARLLMESGKTKQSIAAYRQALGAGNSGAALMLGRYYLRDEKLSPYKNSGEDMLNVAQNMLLEQLARGDCSVLFTIGTQFLRKYSGMYAPQVGLKWLEASVRSGNVYALMRMGDIYAQGAIVSQNIAKAADFYKRAAEAGHLGAMYEYANLLLQGGEGEKDIPTALAWLEKAAEGYFVPAMEQLVALYHKDNDAIEFDAAKRAYWLEKWVQIDSRNAALLFELSEIYRIGEGVDSDLALAFSYAERAAKEGGVEAYVSLGNAYRYGLGIAAEPIRAYRFYRYAANKNNRDAMLALADMYGCGKGREADAALATRWQEMAFYAGAAKAVYEASEQVFFAMNSEAQARVFRKMQLRAEEGDRYAMLWMSLFYEKGIVVDADAEKAKKLRALALLEGKQQGKTLVSLYKLAADGYIDMEDSALYELLEKASELGEPAAWHELGKVHLNGLLGQGADMSLAKEYYQKAAEKEYRGSQRALAKIARKEQSPIQLVVQHFKRAAGEGDANAMLELAGYFYDKGFEKYNPEKAHDYVKRAENYASCTAEDMGALIAAYMKGYGGAEGSKRGMKMLHLRAAQKDVEASEMLAEMYLYGRGVSRDYYKAMEYYTAAAEAGSAASHAMLARASLLGYGVEASYEKARSYWDSAAQGGDGFAKFRSTFNPEEAGLE